MRDQKAQMSVDFLLGMVVFAGLVMFVFQFMSATILPFADTANDNTAKVHNIGNELYYDRLYEGENGVVNLSYFEGAGGLKDEESLKKEFNLNDTRLGASKSLNITVYENNPDGTDDIAELNGEKIAIGETVPEKGASVARSTRIGYREADNSTVIIRVGLW